MNNEQISRTQFIWPVFLFIFYFSLSIVGFAPLAHAATLSMDPTVGKFGPGDTVVVALRIDPDPNECINAVEADINYPSDWMKASLISKGESVFTLWPTEPSIDPKQGLIVLNAGIPGGYCGHIQGDPGKTNLLARIVFALPGTPESTTTGIIPTVLPVTFSTNSRVLLNDGNGTAAPLHLVNAHFTRDSVSHGPTNGWLDLVHQDTTAPDEFIVQVARDPGTYQNKYFLVFSALDKQSGVSHYEVREDDPTRLGFDRTTGKEAPFMIATSPYVLLDQELRSRITVHAFDQAGNMRESIVPPKNLAQPVPSFPLLGMSGSNGTLIGIGGIIVLVLIVFMIWRSLRRRNMASNGNGYDKSGPSV